MAKFLRDLLEAADPMFGVTLRGLERSTGHSGIDVRLIGDIVARAHEIMRKLGLDPADTTAHELYNLLKSQSINRNLFKNTEYVGLVFGSEVISFNYDDIQENAKKPFAERTIRHMQNELQQELVNRYHSHPQTDKSTVLQLAGEAGLTVAQPKKRMALSTDKKAPRILSIGDIFTDAFIQLREDKARIDIDPDGSKRLSMEFGSKPPYVGAEIVQAVGPSPNASVAFSRLGLDAGLMAYLGDDQPGKDSLAYLQREGVDTSTMSVTPGMKSNYYYVLRYGADRTILVKNEDYQYDWQEPQIPPDWIYLSLTSDASWQLHLDMLSFLKRHPDTKLAFQPGTFHFEWGTEKLAPVYKRSYIVVMNREEAALVTTKEASSIPALAKGLHELGPEIVVITDGPDGAYFSYDGRIMKMPNYPDPAEPFDRTGAGDAFASTIVAALALGEPIETAMTWAPINSMSVVQKLGAQAGLLHKDELLQYLSDAPEWYKPERLG